MGPTEARNTKTRIALDPLADAEGDDVLDAVSNWLRQKVALPVDLGKETDTL